MNNKLSTFPPQKYVNQIHFRTKFRFPFLNKKGISNSKIQMLPIGNRQTKKHRKVHQHHCFFSIRSFKTSLAGRILYSRNSIVVISNRSSFFICPRRRLKCKIGFPCWDTISPHLTYLWQNDSLFLWWDTLTVAVAWFKKLRHDGLVVYFRLLELEIQVQSQIRKLPW